MIMDVVEIMLLDWGIEMLMVVISFWTGNEGS